MKKFETLIELIYRNFCFKQTRCTGCKAKDETTILNNAYKSDRCCLIKKLCIFDLIEKEMICEDCPCFSKDDFRCCKLLNDSWYGKKPIKELKYCGYWKVNLYD